MSRPRAKMHQVRVTASRDGGNVRFEAGSEIWEDSTGSLRFHKDRHGLRKLDFHLIEFVLADETGEGLRFPDIPHDAMWVAKAGIGAQAPCPTRDTASDYEVLDPICVSDDGQRLIVRNNNPRREQWAFTLNFVMAGRDADDPDNYVSWDPIIDNHNGG
jgi:hypothetical protein